MLWKDFWITAETFSAIAENAVGAILSFLDKAVWLVAEHRWDLIVFLAEFIEVWLVQKVNNQLKKVIRKVKLEKVIRKVKS